MHADTTGRTPINALDYAAIFCSSTKLGGPASSWAGRRLSQPVQMYTLSADSGAQELEAKVRQLGIDGHEKDLILALPTESGWAVFDACREAGLANASDHRFFVESMCRQRWESLASSLGIRADPFSIFRGQCATLPQQLEEIPAWYAEQYEQAIKKPLQSLAFDPTLDVALALRKSQPAGSKEANNVKTKGRVKSADPDPVLADMRSCKEPGLLAGSLPVPGARLPSLGGGHVKQGYAWAPWPRGWTSTAC